MRARILPILALLLTVAPAMAREGMIPIHAATTITESGHYLVTRDIDLTAGAQIIVQAVDVTLDLGGHTLWKPPTTSYVISIDAVASDVVIRNGRIVGGGGGVWRPATGNPLRILLEDLEVVGGNADGVTINDATIAEVRRCRILDSGVSGIVVVAHNVGLAGHFADNTVDSPARHGIELRGLRGGIVRGNVVANHGTALAGMSGIRISLQSSTKLGGNLVTGNTVRNGGPDAHGITILPEEASGNLVSNNVVTANGALGLSLASSGNHVVGNVARDNGGTGFSLFSITGVSHNVLANNQAGENGTTGIDVWGSYNAIRDNLSEGNGSYGITFTTFHDSSYRDNMLRANGVAAVGGTGSGTDAGGNLP